MKKLHLFKTILLLCALVVGSTSVWAIEIPAYTFTITGSSNNAYAENYDVTIDSKDWNVPGNHYADGQLRLGGKGGSKSSSVSTVDRIITGKSSISDAITKITVNHGGRSNANLVVNSVKLTVASKSDFSDGTDYVLNPTIALNTDNSFTFTPTAPATEFAANSYYKFTFNITITGNTNYYLLLKSIVFYKNAGADYVEAPTITPSNQFMVEKGTEVTITQDAASYIKYTTNGTDPKTYGTTCASGQTITINETKTIKAVAYDASDNVSDVTEKTYTIRPELILSKSLTFTDFNETPNSYGEQDITYTLDEVEYSGWHGVQIMKSDGKVQMKSNAGILITPTIKSANGFTIKVTTNSNKTVTMSGENSESSTLSGNVASLTTTSTSTKITINGNSGGTSYITKIEIIPTDVTVTIGTSKYGSYCSSFALNFSKTDVKAYKAKVDEGKVVLTLVNYVPANEGVILYCETPGDYDIPVVASASAVTENELIGVTSRTLVEWGTGGDGKYNYILQQGAFKKATDGGYLKANRAYLHTTYNVTSPGAHDLEMVFDGDVTGIKNLTTTLSQGEGVAYNLAGQRVNANHKGLVIVNGKKYLNK